MSEDFQFDVNSYSADENHTIGKFMWFMIRAFALAFSGLTTAAFFYSYVGNAFDFFFGVWSPFVVAVAGVIALDGLSQAWAYVRGNHATTIAQMSAARIMSWGNLVGSVVVTIVYLLLNSAFDIGIYQASGELTAIGYWLNVTGVTILVVAIAANFIAAHVYVDTSADNRNAVQRTKLAAMASAGRYHVDDQRQRMVISNTVQDIRRQLPDLAVQQGQRTSQEYLHNQFQQHAHDPAYGPAAPNSGPIWADNGVQAYSVERPHKNYALVSITDGRVSISTENMTLREAWQRVDNGAVGEETFVAMKNSLQPVGRDGKPIDIRMVFDDDDFFVDFQGLVPGGNGIEDPLDLGTT